MADAPKITNELFRFVTVRNPEPATIGVSSGSSSSSSSIVSATYNTSAPSALFNQLQAAKIVANKDAAAALKALTDATKVFAGTEKFKKTSQDWDRTAANITEFITQFRALSIEQRTQSGVRGLANKLFGNEEGPSASGMGTDALISLAWDNLFAYNIVGADVRAAQAAMTILRIAGGLKSLDAYGGTIPEDYFEQPVLLPAEIFPLPKAETKAHITDTGGGTSEGMSQPDIDAVNDAFETTDRISIAISDLNAAYGRQIEEQRISAAKNFRPIVAEDGTQSPPDEENKDQRSLGIIDDDFLRRLTDETIELLEQKRLTKSVSVAFVVEQLSREQSDLTRKAQQKLMLNPEVIQVGGALLRKTFVGLNSDPISEGPISIKGWNSDPVPIGGGTIFSTGNGCRVKPLGIADYRRVEQTLICYKPGEVAHIENILKGEAKERSTRRLSRTEDTTTYTRETETTDERDTITTDRYQMEKETSRVMQQDNALAVGVTVQGKYGPTSVTATANFSAANSTTQSDAQAVSYGKDVTERALRRVVERTTEQQIHKVIEEFEELNKHTVDNIGGAGHIVGLYRWVDKIYEARVVNYGKRLMFEFLVPDPAAFHRFAMTRPITSQVSISEPLNPVTGIADIQKTFPGITALTAPSILDENNYLLWAGLYNVKVEAPPAQYIKVGTAKSKTNMPNDGKKLDNLASNDLQIPEGYKAASISYSVLHGYSAGSSGWLGFTVGGNFYQALNWGVYTQAMSGEQGILPIAITGRLESFIASIEVQCVRTQELFDAWKIKTFNAIRTAYEAKLAEYNNAIAEAKVQMGIEMDGTNPAINRQIEQMELKKHSVRLLSACGYVPSEAMKDNYAGDGYPDFDCCLAIGDGKYVQFVEQCFDWELMTYNFYPYFWSRKAQWTTIYRLTDADPIFLQFLQAGYARVVVPVALGYEEAAMRFAADGTIWNGGDVPGINDKYYRDIVDALKKPIGTQVGDPWQIRVPTTLTILQKDAEGIDASGLPCDPKGI